ncbi:zinc-binding metallopeptidase family protein [Pseudomarimonas salicorniae]|uniref:Zinc-binding peptidase n=1 Tax=Pseudomarimonas salicorniae TaxID=2933270 RepID=A0ABT0GJR3_9GAMM|nr:putative zinc-binding metallopeptidase [Lysobacter sp. CAU 1642]MCK7594787.1 putative zinc-binding peptidase [Lysobacter sp. CAU 1642]
MRVFRCESCGALTYLSSSACVQCQAELGFLAEERCQGTFWLQSDGRLLRHGRGDEAWRRCANFQTACACNWMLREDDPNTICLCCRLTVSLPDQSLPENQAAWRDLEAAKRSWMSNVLDLYLPVRPRSEDPERGLAFHFLRQLDADRPVLTGHASGEITINAIESDPVERERSKINLREPYRTLLGHVRHESGHYYWDLLIKDSPLLEPFRALFGDEREDYSAALQRHYDNGPPADWQSAYVSGYATMHPWEDWAETWAHYLHMVDLIQTARAWQLEVGAFDDSRMLALLPESSSLTPEFIDLLKRWTPLTLVANSLNRSLGQGDAYPFALPYTALRKIQFVHDVVKPFHPQGGFLH